MSVKQDILGKTEARAVRGVAAGPNTSNPRQPRQFRHYNTTAKRGKTRNVRGGGRST